MSKQGKIWGTTEALLKNPIVEWHRIEVNKGFKCSVHKHSYKHNAFYVEKGALQILIYRDNVGAATAITGVGNSISETIDRTLLTDGDHTTIAPNVYHCFVALEDTIAFELYWPELLTEDIRRLNSGGPVDGAE